VWTIPREEIEGAVGAPLGEFAVPSVVGPNRARLRQHAFFRRLGWAFRSDLLLVLRVKPVVSAMKVAYWRTIFNVQLNPVPIPWRDRSPQ
jgi:hypothetical protein